MSRPDVRLIVATHKAYAMPEDDMYVPLHVGAALHDEDPGFLRDDAGDNISTLNPSFCELTGLYWAWKHLDADYLGMVHYRRYFALEKPHTSKNLLAHVLQHDELAPLLSEYSVFVPSKRHYMIESLYSHYKHTHYAEQLDLVRTILEERYPDYLNSYDKIVNKKSGYMFNMMILRRDLFDEYCTWVFDVLFTLKDRLPPEMEQLTGFQGRFYGRISEIIFNVWLDHQLASGRIGKSEVRELPVLYIERTNWIRKGGAFLAAKFLGRKYKRSF